MSEAQAPDQGSIPVSRVQARIDRASRLSRELDRRRRDEAIRYYAPHPKQVEFHAQLSRVRILSWGNQTGKTTAGAAEDVAHMYGYRPWLPPDHPDYIVKHADGRGGWRPIKIPTMGIIAGETNETLRKVQLPSLLGDASKGVPGLIPREDIEHTSRNAVGVTNYIRLKNKSELFLMTYEQEDKVYEGWRVDWAHFDEPPSEAKYKATRRGLLAKLGNAWFTMTPLTEPWIYDKLICNPKVWTSYASMECNIGYGLTRQAYEEFLEDLDPEETEARIHGRFLHLSGLVYKGYDPKIHRVARQANPLLPHYGYWMHADIHHRKPHRAVWCMVRPDDVKFVIGEIDAPRGNLISDFAAAIFEYEQKVLRVPSNNFTRLIDPLAKTPSATGVGATVLDELRDAGLFFRPGSKNRDAAIHLMRAALHYDWERRRMPMIYFFDDLEKMHYEMTHYRYDDKSGSGGSVNPDATPEKRFDDSIEGVHRFLLDKPCASFTDADDDDEYYGSRRQHRSTAGAGY